MMTLLALMLTGLACSNTNLLVRTNGENRVSTGRDCHDRQAVHYKRIEDAHLRKIGTEDINDGERVTG
jgi:hypothetical protein